MKQEFPTGLPGAGKSTIASLAAQALINAGIPAEMLDGDDIRTALSPSLGFSREDRALQARRLAWLAEMLSRHGVVPIIAAVSPHLSDRQAAAEMLGSCFSEVWVHADAEVCRAHDPKGLWRRCERGEITELTGLDSPYEAPLAANLKLNTENNSAESCAADLVEYVVALRVNALLSNR